MCNFFLLAKQNQDFFEFHIRDAVSIFIRSYHYGDIFNGISSTMATLIKDIIPAKVVLVQACPSATKILSGQHNISFNRHLADKKRGAGCNGFRILQRDVYGRRQCFGWQRQPNSSYSHISPRQAAAVPAAAAMTAAGTAKTRRRNRTIQTEGTTMTNRSISYSRLVGFSLPDGWQPF